MAVPGVSGPLRLQRLTTLLLLAVVSLGNPGQCCSRPPHARSGADGQGKGGSEAGTLPGRRRRPPMR